MYLNTVSTHTVFLVGYPHKDERLLSKGTVVPCLWGSETLEFGIKQVDKGKISAVKR